MRRSHEFAVGLLAHEGGRQLTERTPDDALRYQSVMFALAKALDKVRSGLLGGRRVLRVRCGAAPLVSRNTLDGRPVRVMGASVIAGDQPCAALS